MQTLRQEHSLIVHFSNDRLPDLVYCVFVFSSHSFWTSSSLDVPAGVTQEEGHTGFLIHLLSAVRAFNFLARRIQPFLSLVDREVEFCVLLTIYKSFSTRWAFLFLFSSFLVRKIPFAGIELTSQRVRGLRGGTSELPGRPVLCLINTGIIIIIRTVVHCSKVQCSTVYYGETFHISLR